MGKNKLPNRWNVYSNIGRRVSHTRFLPFKVPLKEKTCQKFGVSFSPEDLLAQQLNIKLIIDLTNVADGRYYYGDSFTKHGIQIAKIKCPGAQTQIPSKQLLEQFYDTVDDFLNNNLSSNQLIGVHCTHGLNRTGYFICKYMIDRLKIRPRRALRYFESARGHRMERHLLINDILSDYLKEEDQEQLQSPSASCYSDAGHSRARSNKREVRAHLQISPLASCYEDEYPSRGKKLKRNNF